MSDTTLNAEVRTEFGKGAARRTRRAGKLPAVLYGHGEDPRHLAISALDFAAAIRRGGMTTVLTITIGDGGQVTALPKAIQRDPIRNSYQHADLLLVRRGEKVTVEIPVHLVGEAAKGTLLLHEQDRLAVTADATRLPDHLEASVEGLDVGERVTAGDLPLPAGAELAADPEAVIVIASASPTAAQMEAEVEAPEAAPEAEAAAAPAAEAAEKPPSES